MNKVNLVDALANNNKNNINLQILQQILMAPAAVASSGSSPTTTNSLQDMSAAAAAIALDMKPKVELAVVPAQKIKKCAYEPNPSPDYNVISLKQQQ